MLPAVPTMVSPRLIPLRSTLPTSEKQTSSPSQLSTPMPRTTLLKLQSEGGEKTAFSLQEVDVIILTIFFSCADKAVDSLPS